MEHKKTLNLPKTNFPMKANLSQREPQFLEKWKKTDIYELIRKKQAGKQKFVLHDGPPYANGTIHMGHVLNKVLKDIVVKYKTMRGYDAPYIPGWDCHGLPIEYQLLKELGKSKHDLDKVEFRKQARRYAGKYVKIQGKEFQRLGVFGDWGKPYLTMVPAYAATVIGCFEQLYNKGYIYRGLKPILWCPHCETALAEAEVEYDNHVSPSIFVKFKVKNGLPEAAVNLKNVSMVIWTTTPWTLPANLAVAIRPEYTYSFVQQDNSEEILVIAKQLVQGVMETVGTNDFKRLLDISGKELEKTITQHPFIDRESPIVFSEHVTLEHGTGCVHTAPGHGEEDFEVGLHYGLPIYAPVTEKGAFIKDVEHFGGLNVFKANPLITEYMKKNGSLLHAHKLEHPYPHCWRCKQPIIYRATKQWFLGVDRHDLRQQVLESIKHTNWIPAIGEKRINSMVMARPDWCLSRQRLWGVPIPVFYCNDCDTELVTTEIIDYVKDLVEKEGSDIWFQRKANELLPPGTKCPKCGKHEFSKEEDILDVWFDSGTSHQAVLHTRSDLVWPADLYLEGSDQHRGWFQTSLLTAVSLEGKAPYKTVLTHGFVVDGDGRKMSKSLGNVIAPQDILPKYGADILRLWVASIDYKGDLPISPEILSQLADSYRKLRNTFRFLLSNLYDFNPNKDSVASDKMLELDRWIVGRTHRLLQRVTAAYDKYQFHEVYHSIYNFCVVELSAFYLDILKDRLYTSIPDSLERRSAQTALTEILRILLRLVAPVLPFTAEEIWQYLPEEMKQEESVHLSDWLEPQAENINSILEPVWDQLFNVRAEVLKVLEESRRKGVVGSPLEARVELLLANPELKQFLNVYNSLLPAIFIVSQVDVKDYIADSAAAKEALPAGDVWGLYVLVTKAKGDKCVRCWNWSETVGQAKDHPQICERCYKVVKELI